MPNYMLSVWLLLFGGISISAFADSEFERVQWMYDHTPVDSPFRDRRLRIRLQEVVQRIASGRMSAACEETLSDVQPVFLFPPGEKPTFIPQEGEVLVARPESGPITIDLRGRNQLRPLKEALLWFHTVPSTPIELYKIRFAGLKGVYDLLESGTLSGRALSHDQLLSLADIVHFSSFNMYFGDKTEEDRRHSMAFEMLEDRLLRSPFGAAQEVQYELLTAMWAGVGVEGVNSYPNRYGGRRFARWQELHQYFAETRPAFYTDELMHTFKQMAE